jgi:uncharacterized protein (TIGR02596 family)
MAFKTVRNSARGAFTLIELLVVITIGAILATLSISSFISLVNSGALTTAMQSAVGVLDQARQTAVSLNSYVEVRIYELPLSSDNPTTGTPVAYRGLQTFLVTPTGYTQLSKVTVLPTPLQLAPDIAHSSLLDSSATTGDTSLILRTPASWGTVTPPIGTAPSLPVYQNNYGAVTFRFTPKGSLNLNNTNSSGNSIQWFFTLYSSRDKIVANSLPANFATIQIDGFTGKTIYYRP